MYARNYHVAILHMSFIGNSVLLRMQYRTGAHYLVVAEDNTQRYFSISSSLDVNFRTAKDINSR